MPSRKAKKASPVRRKPSSRKSTARRAVSTRKAAKRSHSVARHKAATARHKKPAKKIVAKKQIKKIAKQAPKKILKAKTPVKALSKAVLKSQTQRLINQKQMVPAKAKPIAPPKIVGTMLARPAAPAPIARTERFSTTATVAKQVGNSKIGYRVNEYVVYPTHGVGQIVSIEEQMIAGLKIELFVVFFAKDRMTLRVPVGKIASVGMRKISEGAFAAKAMETLKGRPRIKRTMWSRRAQEYEAKINSGDLIAVAEVVRDLYRADTQPEQSYSERQLFEAALDRLVREIAVVNKASEAEATQMVEAALQKSPRKRAAVAATPAGDENVVAFKKKADNDDASAQEEKAA
jgi:CarD family transcriptional regulator